MRRRASPFSAPFRNCWSTSFRSVPINANLDFLVDLAELSVARIAIAAVSVKSEPILVLSTDSFDDFRREAALL